MPTSKPRPETPAKKRILLVDDHAMMRRGLMTVIEAELDLMVCAEVATRRAGLNAIVSSKPDLVIADLSLRDSDGVEIIKDIKQRFPDLPVLVLSMHDEAVYAERALRAGARGYVSKQEIDETVLTAIRRVLAGDIHTSRAMSRQFIGKFIAGAAREKRNGLELLTDRELEVFNLIGRGRKNAEIARHMTVSTKTIQAHKEHLKAKLRLSSTPELIRCAAVWVETGRMG